MSGRRVSRRASCAFGVLAAALLWAAPVAANDAAHTLAEKFAADVDGNGDKNRTAKQQDTLTRQEAVRQATAEKERARAAEKERARGAEKDRARAEARRRAEDELRQEETEMLARARREADEMRSSSAQARLAEEARRLIEAADRERVKGETLLAAPQRPNAAQDQLPRRAQDKAEERAEEPAKQRVEDQAKEQKLAAELAAELAKQQAKQQPQSSAQSSAQRNVQRNVQREVQGEDQGKPETRPEPTKDNAEHRQDLQGTAAALPPIRLQQSPASGATAAATGLEGDSARPATRGADEEEALARQRAEETRRLAEKLRRVRQIRQARRAAQARRDEERTLSADDLPVATPSAAPPEHVASKNEAGRAADAAPRAAPAEPATVATAPWRATEPSAFSAGSVSVLLLLEPGRYGIRRHGPRVADPVLCNLEGCYVSMGAQAPAQFLPGRRALGFANTFGERAGACRQSLGCVFRDVRLGPPPGYLQPVDLHILRHDRRRGQVVMQDSGCIAQSGSLFCSRGIYADDYVMWIVPEKIAAAAGAEALLRALDQGLKGPKSAELAPRE